MISRMMIWAAAAFILLSIHSLNAQDKQKNYSEKEITAIVEKLGAGSFKERRQARETLLKIGYPAKVVLEKYRDSNDPELKMSVGYTCSHLIVIDMCNTKMSNFQQIAADITESLMKQNNGVFPKLNEKSTPSGMGSK